jgi:hypothetical protein
MSQAETLDLAGMTLRRSVAFRHHRLARPTCSGAALTGAPVLVTRFASRSQIPLGMIHPVTDVVHLGGHADAHRVPELTGPAVTTENAGPVAEELAAQCRPARTA